MGVREGDCVSVGGGVVGLAFFHVPLQGPSQLD